MTFFGLVRPDGCMIGCFNGFFCACPGHTPTPQIENGIRIFPAQGGARGMLVVEARKGSNNVQVGSTTTVQNPCTTRPTIQIETQAPMGDGSPILCIDPDNPQKYCEGGIPATDPPDFGSDQNVTAAMNEFACHFQSPVTAQNDACTQNFQGNFAFLGGFTSTGGFKQFCYNVNQAAAFDQGDNLLTIQVADQNGLPGPTAQVIIRVPTRTPTPP